MKNLAVKSFSIMKKQRESMNQIGPLEKQALITCLASMGATHIEMTMLSADTGSSTTPGTLKYYGNNPNPRTEEAETQQWYDIVHATPNVYGASVYGGYLKVFDRVVFPQMGDNSGKILNFPIETNTPVGTAAGITTYYDDFNRSSVGTNYTTAADGGTGNDWTMSSNQLRGPSGDGWRRTCLTTSSYSNFITTAKVKKVGNQMLVGRATTNSNLPGYGFQIRSDAGGRFQLERPGLEVITNVSRTFTENNFYWIKMSCNGNAIKGKVWDVNDSSFPLSTDGSENEPLTGGLSGNDNGWDIEVTRTDFSSGQVGFGGESNNGLFDNLTITPIAPSLNSTWVGRYKNYLYNHVGISRIKVGDIGCPFAEITGTEFGSTWFMPNIPTAITLVTECHKVWNQFCIDAGIPPQIFLNNPNWTETNSGNWPGTGYSDTGFNCYDYYGNGPDSRASRKGSGYVQQLTSDFNGINFTDFNNATPGGPIPTGGYPQIWGEWGDLAHSIFIGDTNLVGSDNITVGKTTVEQWQLGWFNFMRALRDGVVNTTPRILYGFNYWGGWENQNTSVVYKTGSGESSVYRPNWRGQIIRDFFINDGMGGRLPVITQGSFTEADPSFGGRQQTY